MGKYSALVLYLSAIGQDAGSLVGRWREMHKLVVG